MKTNRLIVFWVGISLLLTACKAFKPQKYEPSVSLGQEQQLVNLTFITPDFKEDTLGFYGLRLQKDIQKVYKAGLEDLCNNGMPYGYFSFKIKELEPQARGVLFLMTSFLTFGVSNLAGLPFAAWQTKMTITYSIYDANQNLVANYTVNVNPRETRTWAAAYYGYSLSNVIRISKLKAHKLAFEEFSTLVTKDVFTINQKLIGGGTIEPPGVLGNAPENFSFNNTERENDNETRSNNTFTEIADKFRVEQRSGSGFVISNKGYILTNYHIVRGAKEIVLYFGARERYRATVVFENKERDIAVLKVDGRFKPKGALPYTFSDEYNMGSEVFSIGYPITDTAGAAYKYSLGKVNSLLGIENSLYTMKVSTPVLKGSSGAPLFNQRGDIVGITINTRNSFYREKHPGRTVPQENYAIKADMFQPLIKQYNETTENATAQLSRVEQIMKLSSMVCLIRVY